MAPQSVVVRQLPATQALLTQRWLAPHWVSVVQAEQLFDRQALPFWHSLLVLWQSPVTQTFATQMFPLP